MIQVSNVIILSITFSSSCFYVPNLRMYRISPFGWILMSKFGIVTNWKSPSLAFGKNTSGFQIACTSFGSARSRGSCIKSMASSYVFGKLAWLRVTIPSKLLTRGAGPSMTVWGKCPWCSPDKSCYSPHYVEATIISPSDRQDHNSMSYFN